MGRGMVKVWAIALVWLLAVGAASAVHWQAWSEGHPALEPEDCSLQFPPNSAELVGCYEDRIDLMLDRRGELTLHVGVPLIPSVVLVFLALGIGWVQRDS